MFRIYFTNQGFRYYRLSATQRVWLTVCVWSFWWAGGWCRSNEGWPLNHWWHSRQFRVARELPRLCSTQSCSSVRSKLRRSITTSETSMKLKVNFSQEKAYILQVLLFERNTFLKIILPAQSGSRFHLVKLYRASRIKRRGVYDPNWIQFVEDVGSLASRWSED